jgi:F0F1-type ATP synthase delta subunit
MKTLRRAQGKQDVLIYFDLITSLKTTQEVSNFVSEIDTFLRCRTLDSISTNSCEKIKQIFTKNNLDIDDNDTIAGFFETLKELLKKFKVIKLVLAFDPTRKTIENIHNFVKDSLGIGYVLDIEVQENILGGAIVMFEGKYNDFSLKKSIEDTFRNKESQAISYVG